MHRPSCILRHFWFSSERLVGRSSGNLYSSKSVFCCVCWCLWVSVAFLQWCRTGSAIPLPACLALLCGFCPAGLPAAPLVLGGQDAGVVQGASPGGSRDLWCGNAWRLPGL